MHTRHRAAAALVLFVTALLSASGCSTPSASATPDHQQREPQSAGTGDATAPATAVRLSPDVEGWTTANRAAINEMLASHGASAKGTPSGAPVAVFDWDNTIIKNDIGDATMRWMIAHDLIYQPPKKDWKKTNTALTDAAVHALGKACDDAAAPGTLLETQAGDKPNACGAEIWSVYADGKTTAGEAAWTNPTTATMEQPYAWAAQLQAGHTPKEVNAFALKAFEERLNAPIEGGEYIRVYQPMKDLIAKLHQDGFDVWIVTASPQHVVEALSEHAGVPADHVVGIRSVVSAGKLTYDLQECGPAKDGDNTVMTYDVGKRCWINKAIFGVPADQQMSIPKRPSERPVFAAGDSDTDVGMLDDATALHLVLDRHKHKVMCRAQANADGHWLVQPMFIDPKPERAQPYSCPQAR